MGFITQLGKGFIRSAVNQVGRDGGKVISNSLYGDAHSTPIRRAGQAYAEQPQRLPPPTKEGEYDDDTKKRSRGTIYAMDASLVVLGHLCLS